LVQLPAERTTSEEAAAATAAAAVLATIDPKTASEMKVALATYLGSIPEGTAKLDGIQLGEAVLQGFLRHEKMMAAMNPMTIGRGLHLASMCQRRSQRPQCG
jgi:hypothetical protein